MSRSYFIGIDPGLTGCVAFIDDRGRYIDHLHMPVMRVGSKGRVNGAQLAAWLKQHNMQNITHVMLERVGAMPKQGGSSMFSFGHSAGVAEGIVQGLGIPYTLVEPAIWKKKAGLIGQDKDAARGRAIQLYPDLRDLDLKGKGQALADALLIARFGAIKESTP